MSFDDNYLFNDPYAISPASCDDPDGFPAFQDSNPFTADCEPDRIQMTIDENATWLQEAPRTSLSIIYQLFPGSIRRMSDFSDQAELIGNYLWDAGYVAEDTDTCNPTWHWLEGKSLPLINATSEHVIPIAFMDEEDISLALEQIKGA